MQNNNLAVGLYYTCVVTCSLSAAAPAPLRSSGSFCFAILINWVLRLAHFFIIASIEKIYCTVEKLYVINYI